MTSRLDKTKTCEITKKLQTCDSAEVKKSSIIQVSFAVTWVGNKINGFKTLWPLKFSLGYITKYAEAISNGALDVDADQKYTIKVAEQMADKYASSNDNVLRMTFGGGDAEYMQELESSLREALSELIINIEQVNRIWITAGSATAPSQSPVIKQPKNSYPSTAEVEK